MSQVERNRRNQKWQRLSRIAPAPSVAKKFEVAVYGGNRMDADSRAEWVAENYDTCTACYRADKDAEFAHKIASYALPEIKAVSDRQRDYANDLRVKYIRYNSGEIDFAADILGDIDHDAVAAMAAESGKSEDEIVRDAMAASDLIKPYIVLTCADARTIIDTIKG